jgi:hypothetical protein
MCTGVEAGEVIFPPKPWKRRDHPEREILEF